MEKKLFLLDAMALIYRAYYALLRNPRLTSQGKNTNAQFGFTNTLLELLNKYKPTHMAVCFDTHAPTERHSDFEDYKANRQKAPEDLLDSIPDIKRIIEGFNIPCIESDGYEADDIIGTLAWQAADAGYKVFMVTPDKDYGQLLTKPGVFIYKPAYMGKKEEILTAEKICEKWDIARVEQVIDVLGLMGDAVDNIPGIPGVGEKTAAKLLKQYDSLENILEHAHEIKGALGKKVQEGKESAILSKKLATIITDVPVTFHEEDFCIKEFNQQALSDIFSELEFRSLGKRILGESFKVDVHVAVQRDLFGNVVESSTTISETTKAAGDAFLPEEEIIPLENKTIENTPHQYHLVQGDAAIKELIGTLRQYEEICFDTETTGTDANNVELVGMSFSVKAAEGYYVPVSADQAEANRQVELFSGLFSDPNITWIGQNLKYDLLVMKWYGQSFPGKIFDTMVAHYVIEPEGRRNMDLLSEKYLGYTPVSITELIGKKGKNQGNMRDVPAEKAADYAAEDADITLQLKEVFKPLIREKAVEKVFYEADLPLVKVLADMEFEGIRVDEDFLKNYSSVLESDAAIFEKQVYEAAGVHFNLASPKQLGEVLFEKLKLDPKAKKTKTGQYATGEDVLSKLAVQHKIADDILSFRELTKLRNTYVDAIPQLINPKTGRVHTSYNQTLVVTGRLSSNNPNLQNIPVRTERGKEIRKAFIPRDKDHVLFSADYSQIELRVVAAISGDKNMCEAFKSGADIHTATAAKVFGVDESEVTKEQRYKAKSVNFGIIYGQGAFGLGQNLGISRTEAKTIIDNYKTEFSGIAKYMEDTIARAQQNGYVETLLGRKAWIRDINSANFTVKGFAERVAINAPIQGTAADMIKLAMIGIHNEMQQRKLRSKMILQVHDELVFDVHKDELDELKELVLHKMQTALPLPEDVPVVAEIGTGNSWLEAH
ncbi:DNA polymerase I [Arachidicoccus terrestris]|uniref:DNA polymerase I n=1 Tax=Arachidicoccus terrestris TaxID=2875539 RepID=UPI001CC5A7CA|nr:DNA polymerase I [Arachidicoccus terrestris]UAY54878.1 DNA polymerase I [Arachidicoccus terrestris]